MRLVGTGINTAKLFIAKQPNGPAYLVAGLVLVLLPVLVAPYLRDIITKILIYAIFATSLNLLCGYTGLFSLGHAAYFGVAGYTTSVLMVRYGVESFWIVAPAGVLMASLMAAAFGFVALRGGRTYFLLVTLAFGQLIYSVALKWRTMTGGTNGLVSVGYPDLGLPGFTMSALSFYYFVSVILVFSFFLLYRLVKSPFGVALQAIRENETRMQSLGYNTWLYKYIAFIVAGLFAGVAGTLFSYHTTILVPSQVGILASALVMLMVIIGGKRVFWGPTIGAIVIVFVEHYSSLYFPTHWPLILGCFFVIAVMFLRGGISIYLIKPLKRVASSCIHSGLKV